VLFGYGYTSATKSRKNRIGKRHAQRNSVRTGAKKNLVGVDVTSTYPESLKKLPKIGHNRNISAEGILALRPTVFVGIRSQLSHGLEQQLQSAGIKVLLYEQEYSLQGTQQLIR
jgi:iron complex transport system substrate-binding protein